MELDELKAAWISLDNRLKDNEKLKESIILEMMRSKVGKTLNRFIAFEMFSTVVMLVFIPFFIFQLERFAGKNLAASITLIFGATLCFISFFWYVYKTHGLMKIDLSKNVGNNIFYANRYNIQIKREKRIIWCFVAPTITTLLLLTFASEKVKVPIPIWFLLICALTVGMLGTYWQYKCYDKGIDSILKSLDEIRELKEE
jgi:TM2 domain-containing membrane protein YozV